MGAALSSWGPGDPSHPRLVPGRAPPLGLDTQPLHVHAGSPELWALPIVRAAPDTPNSEARSRRGSHTATQGSQRVRGLGGVDTAPTPECGHPPPHRLQA